MARSKDYITGEGAQALQRELDRLWLEERPKITQGVADAAAEGDRSENAEYIYGKKKLREIDRKIRHLRKRLDAVTIVTDLPPDGTETVFFGAWVLLEDEEGEQVEYRLVGPDETDAAKRFISIDSPVGRALLRKKLDDEVTVKRPKGDTTFVIMAIRYR